MRNYFDWAATSPPDSFSLDVPFANPSSIHAEGRAARAALEDARERCALVLGVPSSSIYFTSGGTESNAIVLHSFLRRKLESGGGGALLYSAVEHPSIRENCLLLQRLGLDCAVLEVERDGRVSENTLEKALSKKNASFVTFMAVNNEIGSVNDIAALTRATRSLSTRPVHVHVDCVQAVGKMPLNLQETDIDSASFSAHKVCGPRGIGALYLKKKIAPLLLGGGQESGMRAGTENTIGALSFAAALEKYARNEVCVSNQAKAGDRMRRLIDGLRALGARIIPEERKAEDALVFSPYIVQVSFDGVPGEVLVRSMSEKGFFISTGSACSSRTQDRAVLRAIGVQGGQLMEGVRISQGFSTEERDIDALLLAFKDAIRELGKSH